jgi:hypothetical protein
LIYIIIIIIFIIFQKEFINPAVQNIYLNSHEIISNSDTNNLISNLIENVIIFTRSIYLIIFLYIIYIKGSIKIKRIK